MDLTYEDGAIVLNKGDICDSLKLVILERLKDKVQSKCIYLDLPYYSNIGDSLIWLGTEEFLKDIGCTCIGKHSKDTFDFRELSQDCTIILQGGGNFGDIWREHQDFRNKVCQTYPKNNIIVLPQTIYYKSEELLTSDIEVFNNHKKLTICARDQYSYDLLAGNGYVGDLLLIPDMAFYINREYLNSMVKECHKDLLLLSRNDKEFPSLDTRLTKADFKDWPGLQESGDIAWKYVSTHTGEEIDDFFQNSFLLERIKEGVAFVSEYKDVYSTRLHVIILRILLGLDVVPLDNSYGKNLHFIETWLKDSSLIKRIDSQSEKEVSVALCYNHRLEEQYNLIRNISLERDCLKETNDIIKKEILEARQEIFETRNELSSVKKQNNDLAKEIVELTYRIKKITQKNRKLKYIAIACLAVIIGFLVFTFK